VSDGARVPIAVSTERWSEEGLTGRRIVTEHFDIRSTIRDAEFEAALPQFLESAYLRYETTLPPPDDTSDRLSMYVFGTRAEWAGFARRRFPTGYEVPSRISAGGFTEGDVSVLFYVSRSVTLATLAHEGWHQYVASRFHAPIPAWLDEGLACYHEAVEFAGSHPKFTPQHNTLRTNSLRKAVRSDRLMSLQEVVDVGASEVLSRHDTDVTQMYEAQVWALVTFLRHGARARHARDFNQLLSDIAHGAFAARVSAARLHLPDGRDLSLGELAFRTYFHCAPDDLGEEYRRHVMRVSGF
jgi:hypothetical protein